MFVRDSLVNVWFAERTTTKNKKLFDSGLVGPGIFRTLPCENECPFGTNMGFDLGAFDKFCGVERPCLKRMRVGSVRVSHHLCFSRVRGDVTHCKNSTLRPTSHRGKKHLHPTVIRQVALNRLFRWPPDRSTPRIEKNDWRSNSRGRTICSAGDAVCRRCPKNACLFIGPDEPGTADREAITGKRGRSRRDPSGRNRTGRAKIADSHSAAIHKG